MNKKIRQKRFLFFTGVILVFVGFFVFFNFVFADSYGLDSAQKSSGIQIGEMTSIENVVARVLSTALTFLSVIFFLLIVYGGGRWMIARGNSDEIQKAQDTIIMAIVGVIIILGANALVNFVFTSVGTGQSVESNKLSACAEVHAGWEILPIAQCAGENYTKNITDVGECYYFEGQYENEGGKKLNCDSNTIDADLVAKKVCCLPYKTKCSRTYSDFECQSDTNNCDIGTAKIQIGLCETAEEICCKSSEVWCLIASFNEENKIEDFNCEKQFGRCVSDGDLLDSRLNFTTVEACRKMGEDLAKISNK
ncbi:MAG: pilin [Patescibacteria group bacterium]